MSDIITLKENREFRRAYTRGRSYVSSDLVTYIIKNNTNNLRIGITTGKKIGKATKRNRCKRIIRAAYSELYESIRPGFDLVFVARVKTPYRKSKDILRSMRKHLKDAGLLEEK
ncbi:MAG: ribonuclease P protein component [Clostridia bacterium]|nr:ribonuclease P protein component [Clostridia bacterium]